jgi:hypothetical protein
MKNLSKLWSMVHTTLVTFTLLGSVEFLHAAEFFCDSGNVTCLIAAINSANATSGGHVINLEPGIYTIQMASGPLFDGLPIITRSIRIQATADDPATIIERDPNAAPFRIFDVSATGQLTLVGVTVQQGSSRVGQAIFNAGITSLQYSTITNSRGDGGAIINQGTLQLFGTIVSDNSSAHDVGGINNNAGGTAHIESSTIAGNGADGAGGISNGGTMVVKDSSVIFNRSGLSGAGAGIGNFGNLQVVNTTIAKNAVFSDFGQGGGGMANFAGGVVSITNSTIRENEVIAGAEGGAPGGGIWNTGGTTLVQNTIVAGNTVNAGPFLPPVLQRLRGPDCAGTVTSLGNNLVGDVSDCGINLQPSDLTGDPGLSSLVGMGPGKAYYPVLAGSPVIDRGNPDVCQEVDQLGTPRLGTCDIGAVEFYPVINDLLTLANLNTAFDSTPLFNAPAGTFHIRAEFSNTSSQAILHRFAQVTELTGGNLLLNADGGPGGVGARLTPPDSDSTVLVPGATQSVEFIIGLQSSDRFIFFVNLLGDARSVSQNELLVSSISR